MQTRQFTNLKRLAERDAAGASEEAPGNRRRGQGRAMAVPWWQAGGVPDPDARTQRILDEVRAIPKGFVRAYSDVDPAAPRLLGRVLATTGADVPGTGWCAPTAACPRASASSSCCAASACRCAARASTWPPRATRPPRRSGRRRRAAALVAGPRDRGGRRRRSGDGRPDRPRRADRPPARQPRRPLRRAGALHRVPAARRGRGGRDPRPRAGRSSPGPLDAGVARAACPTPTSAPPACRPTSWPRCATSRRRCSTAPWCSTTSRDAPRRGDHRAAHLRARHRPLDRRDVPHVRAAAARRVAGRRPRRAPGLRPGLWASTRRRRRAGSARWATASGPTAPSPPATAGRRSRCTAPAPPRSCADVAATSSGLLLHRARARTGARC